MLALVAELAVRRIGMVLSDRKRRLGTGLILPASAANHQLTQRQLYLLGVAARLHIRYGAGHYRHDDKEVSAIGELAGWLIEEHRLSHSSSKSVQFSFNANNMGAIAPPPPGSYKAYVERVRK